jgi:hypothetical protein
MSDTVAVQLVSMDRLHPAEWNPRMIMDADFRRLMDSIKRDPKFLEERPILAMTDGTIYGGNQRYRAVEALYAEGWEGPWGGMIPGRLVDIDQRLAKERALRDNNQWGEWQTDQLTDILAEIQGYDAQAVAALGFSDDDITALLASITEHERAPSDTASDVDDRRPSSRVPTLDELEEEHGEPEDTDFWPVIRIKVSPETHERFTDLMAHVHGGTEAEKFSALLDQIDGTMDDDDEEIDTDDD